MRFRPQLPPLRGHDQFFGNSTGIVWEHAVEGLHAVGLPEVAAMLTAASQRLGGASRHRAARQAQVDLARVDFTDLDERFFEISRTSVLDDKMLAFARQHPAEFRFDGTVSRLVLPPRGELRLLYPAGRTAKRMKDPSR